MFQNSVLDISLMSYELIAVEIGKISLIFIEIWYKMWWKSWKRWKCTVRKNFSHIFNLFFLFKLSQSNNPILGFYNKKSQQKTSFCKKLLRCFKTFKTKKVLKIFNFLFTVYRMRHAIVGGNFTPIGEYSSTAKNRQKWV
jgi:hypothetical protein